MKYLIDTDWTIEVLKGRRETISSVLAFTPDGIGISLISYAEVYEGLLYGLNREKHEQGFERFLGTLEILPLNLAMMQEFARIRGLLRSQGLLIGDLDLLIAATALYHDLILLTNNRSHFLRIPGLRLVPGA